MCSYSQKFKYVSISTVSCMNDPHLIRDGILAIDKPEGISSAGVVARVKKVIGIRKIGHTGTLDPFATGLMLCGIGKGTKLSRFFLGGAKKYVAELTLGVETDTQDKTGAVVDQAPAHKIDAVTSDQIDTTLNLFQGVQMQRPPAYSALKHQGKPLYQLAREGRPVEKPPRQIEIHAIESIAFSPPRLTFSVHCSSGTYIRTLAHDMGRRLGCGAMLSSLRRTETCGVGIDEALPLDHLEKMSREEVLARMIPMAEAISFMPEIHADESLMAAVRFGRPFCPPSSCRKSGKQLEKEPTMVRHETEGLSQLDKTLSLSRFFRVLDPKGDLAAVVSLDETGSRYDYCCVLVN